MIRTARLCRCRSCRCVPRHATGFRCRHRNHTPNFAPDDAATGQNRALSRDILLRLLGRHPRGDPRPGHQAPRVKSPYRSIDPQSPAFVQRSFCGGFAPQKLLIRSLPKHSTVRPRNNGTPFVTFSTISNRPPLVI